MDSTPDIPHRSQPDRLTRILRWVVGGVLLCAVLAAAGYGWTYSVTPQAIRQPASVHVHLRLQVINNGRPVNFADQPYQTDYSKDMCSAQLTKEPIHFHDGKDQFVHLHWQGITGGLLLKDYGWNFIGGPDDTLGYRLDKLPQVAAVPVHGRALPPAPAGANYYVYTGTAANYTARSWNDFLHRNLVDFLSGTDIVQRSWSDWLAPAALAHGDEDHSATASGEDKLVRLNNVIGNVVVFAQKDKPSAAEVKARFEHLEPLPETSCAG